MNSLINTKQEWETNQVALCAFTTCSRLLKFDWCLRWIAVGKDHGNYPHRLAVCYDHTKEEVLQAIEQNTPEKFKRWSKWGLSTNVEDSNSLLEKLSKLLKPTEIPM